MYSCTIFNPFCSIYLQIGKAFAFEPSCMHAVTRSAINLLLPLASRSQLSTAVLWYANSYAIRGLFLRVHGNVRNVGFWDVTTEKRWGAVIILIFEYLHTHRSPAVTQRAPLVHR